MFKFEYECLPNVELIVRQEIDLSENGSRTLQIGVPSTQPEIDDDPMILLKRITPAIAETLIAKLRRAIDTMAPK